MLLLGLLKKANQLSKLLLVTRKRLLLSELGIKNQLRVELGIFVGQRVLVVKHVQNHKLTRGGFSLATKEKLHFLVSLLLNYSKDSFQLNL